MCFYISGNETDTIKNNVGTNPTCFGYKSLIWIGIKYDRSQLTCHKHY